MKPITDPGKHRSDSTGDLPLTLLKRPQNFPSTIKVYIIVRGYLKQDLGDRDSIRRLVPDLSSAGVFFSFGCSRFWQDNQCAGNFGC